jgi:hypothetical protein
VQVYRYLEPLYNDLRKVRQLRPDGGYELNNLDRVVEDMLYKDYLFDIALPRLPKRNELEELVCILSDSLCVNGSTNHKLSDKQAGTHRIRKAYDKP